MDIVLQSYQKDCIDQIFARFSNGEKHLSVTMTTGSGRTFTPLFLADSLATEDNASVAVVFNRSALVDQAMLFADKKLHTEGVSFFTVQDFIIQCFLYSKMPFQYVILHGLDFNNRKQIVDTTNICTIKTVSFISVGPRIPKSGVSYDASYDDALKCANSLSPVICIYSTKDALDIRDAKYLSEAEYNYIYQKNSFYSDILQEKKEQAINGINKQQLIIREDPVPYLRTSKKLRDYQWEYPYEEKATKLEQQLLEERAKKIQIEQSLAFHKAILSALGIDSNTIQSAFELIQKERAALKESLDSSDEPIKEIALKQLQDKSTEIIGCLVSTLLSQNDIQHYKAGLIDDLTESVWNKLDKTSQDSLITAKYTYEIMNRNPEKDTFDYSGVCLHVTKALEVECAKRFLVMYKAYLKQIRYPISDWPYALRQKDPESRYYTENEKPDTEFMLGDVPSLVGLRRERDADGQISYTEYKQKPRELFHNYAKSVLFDYADYRVDIEIVKDCRFIDKVRLDYRNPAAHRDRLSLTSAKECLDYVIEVEHKLKDMLSVMRI